MKFCPCFAVIATVFGVPGLPSAHGKSYFGSGTFGRPQPPPGSFVVIDSGERYGGWKTVGAAGNVTYVKTDYVHRGFQFVAPPKSTAWANLAGTSQTATGIAHAPLPTVPGTQYKITFMVGNLVDPAGVYGTSSTVSVYENSHLVGTVTNSAGAGSTSETWQSYTLSFKAARPWTTIAFINGDPPGDGNCGVGDIDVAAVADPQVTR
jgi:hypothetical protein